MWEQKNIASWMPIDVPSSTCILYVNSHGKYRCTLGGEVYYFDVCGKVTQWIAGSYFDMDKEEEKDGMCSK